MIGTDEELSERLRTHDDYILNQRQKWKAQDAQLQDAEDQIKQTRAEHVELMGRQGKLLAEEQVSGQLHIETLMSSLIWATGGTATGGRAGCARPRTCDALSYQGIRTVTAGPRTGFSIPLCPQ